MDDLHPYELRAFLTLAEQRHFGRTADLLHVTQPALSKQIQRLEEKVGGALVVRGYRDVQLTPAGEVLLSRARLVLQESAAAFDAVRRAVRGHVGTLHIGFGIASMQRLLPDVLRRFRAAYPDVELRLREMVTADQVAALVRGQIDVGFVRLPLAESRLDFRPVLHERLVVASNADAGRPAWRAREGLASLARAPFITIARGTSASYHDQVIAVCHEAGFAPRIVQETNELFTMLMLVRAGMGVALAPHSATLRKPEGVVFRSLATPTAVWDIGVAWNKARAGEPLLKAFVDFADSPRVQNRPEDRSNKRSRR
jgi:DNA-binding transcriptional LysR family regulator